MNQKRVKKVKVFKKSNKKVPETQIIEQLQAKYENIDETKINAFSDLPLSIQTLKGLKESDYIVTTDIQRQSIGLALKGNDILGAAKTGSGKTLAFLIPILEILYCKQWTQMDSVGAIVITPTRELALQIYQTLRNVGRYHDFSAGLIIGGKDLKFEKKRMDRCNIIICTPGRLLQHMDENPLFECVNMQILVLDEADRCLDIGFESTMNAIIENLPENRQTLLFSATQTKSVQDLARLSLKDPLYVSVHEHAAYSTPEALQQSYVVCNLEDKMPMIWSFIRNHLKQKILIFLSSCKQVKYIYEAFCRMRPGVSLLALHGNLSQMRRMDVYESFCKKQHAVLFATDIAARGLDFPSVDWVVQMDCPEDVNAYIHRAGRTARFQKGGESLLVLIPSELEIINRLEERRIPICSIQINPNKLQSPQRKLEALLARDVALKESAQRAFVAYVKSVFLMKDKKIFDVKSLNTDAFAKSMGLAISPRIRFLQKMQKSNSKLSKNSKDKNYEKPDLISQLELHQPDELEKVNASSSNNEDSSKKIIQKKESEKNNLAIANSDESDDDFLTVKRKNVQIEDELPIELETEEDKEYKTKSKKAVTKAAVAKKILKKKIVPNKKTNFDEEGQEVLDSTKSKVSELAKQYEQEDASGINIDLAKQVLQEEDKFDKQWFKEKIKKKHKEEKKKLKAQKKAVEEDEESENEECEEDSDTDDGPDLSWLPDPDEIYGKEDKESEKSDDEKITSKIHRPSKRKLIVQENKSKRKRTSSKTVNENLQADEELALQLLQKY